MKTLPIAIWSDVACPWCYVGKRRLEAALALFPHREHAEVTWHSFELDPSAPRRLDASVSYVERLARKYRTTNEQAEAMISRMTGVAAADGLDFHFEKIRPGNTFDAHRVIHLAAVHGRQDAMKERLLRAYLCEGEAIGEPEVLVRLAAQVGLGTADDEATVRTMLAGDNLTHEVRADQREAQEIGISGVPFFVFAGRFAVSGAQTPDVLLTVLQKTWTAVNAAPSELLEGAACGPDGCA